MFALPFRFFCTCARHRLGAILDARGTRAIMVADLRLLALCRKGRTMRFPVSIAVSLGITFVLVFASAGCNETQSISNED